MGKHRFWMMVIGLTAWAGVAWAGEVALGSVTPLTGKLAVYGEGFQQAMLRAVDDISFSMKPEGISGLIGPNGSGPVSGGRGHSAPVFVMGSGPEPGSRQPGQGPFHPGNPEARSPDPHPGRGFELRPAETGGFMEDGWVVLDARGRFQDLNPVAEKMLGWSAGTLIGRTAGVGSKSDKKQSSPCQGFRWARPPKALKDR